MRSKYQNSVRNFKHNWDLFFLLLPVLALLIIFRYVPMYGVQIAFRNYRAALGIWGSPWVHLSNFQRFINSYQFKQVLVNTLRLAGLGLGLGFFPPIILALMLNQVRTTWFKKTVQTVSYLPHFISTVVIVGILFIFLSPTSGPINQFLKFFGAKPIDFMGKPHLFPWVYVLSGIWQSTGYSAIIYIATLAGIPPDYYEAAVVDGATQWQKIKYIDLPFLFPMMATLFILATGQIMNIGYEKTYLMQTPLNTKSSEIISTMVYKVGLLQNDFSYSTAVDLFNNVINIILILTVNSIVRRISKDNALW